MSGPTIDEQVAILMRGAEFGDEQIKEHMQAELRERLVEADKTGRPLRVYAGFDPTATYLTIGHTVPMRKLRQFQELGHQVTFLIGTFTGLIGDPSDATGARAQQTSEQVAENARTYTEQAFKILERWLTRHLPDVEVPVQAAVVFVNPNVVLNATASPAPAFYGKKVKTWLRGPGTLKPLQADVHLQLAKALGID